MPEQKPTLYLFDSYALIFRAYFAMSKNPLINSKGLNVSAISGYTSVLHDIITNRNPTYLACVFDAPHITDRQVEYDFYKANRQKTPEDIKISVPYIKEIVQAFNLPILEENGYEADDLIGALAKQAEQEGIQVYIVSSDKDMAQLVSENIFLYKPPYMGNPFKILGLKETLEKWEINNPKQVIDILGLWGDAVDNIPGVKGIGEKTAKKLIQDYGSIEGIYEHIDEIKGSLQSKLIQDRENAFISKKLATIITDAPVKFDHKTFLVETPNKEKLSQLFSELEFRTLGRRILGQDYSVLTPQSPSNQMSLFDTVKDSTSATNTQEVQNISNTPHDYQLLTDSNQLEDFFIQAQQKGVLAIDTETTGIDSMNCDLVGISLCIEKQQAYYIPWQSIEQETFKEILNKHLKGKMLKIGQNIKYDLNVLGQHGINISGPFFDTMIAHFLIDPDTRHNMDYLSETYLQYTPVPITDLIGKKGVGQLKMSEIELEQIKEYAAEDADITFQLYQKLEPELKDKGYDKLYEELEGPLIPVLSKMEQAGVAIDTEFLEQYSQTLASEMLEMQDNIFNLAGVHFNLDSPKQLGEILFDHLKIKYPGKKTKTGQYSTNESTLLLIEEKSPIVQDILNYRELKKLKSTYIDALPMLINPRTGLVHTTFNQAIVSTGRLSSTNPNLQNIPVRTERGREIRKAFVPRAAGRKILSADYSQIELRIIASLSKDERMIAAFKNGQDIHSSTAANVYNVPIENVTSEMRRHAKMVNFGIIYGISAFGLAQRLGISRTDAAELIDTYFKNYPGIKNYMNESIETARKHGYAQTIYGRKRFLRDINSANFTVRSFAERNAINAPIQGTAAEMIKIAMVRIDKLMTTEGFKSQMTLQVHDELLFDVLEEEIESLKALVEEEMKNAIKMNVPIEIGMGIGNNWLEAH